MTSPIDLISWAQGQHALPTRTQGPPVAAGASFKAVEPPTVPVPAPPRQSDPLVKFESVMLQSMVELMMPDNAGQVYGEGLAGDMWKSMLAEKISEQFALRGGIGIARMLAGHQTFAEASAGHAAGQPGALPGVSLSLPAAVGLPATGVRDND